MSILSKVKAAGISRRTFGMMLFGTVAMGLAGWQPASAQTSYPERPIRFIVPFAPGGATGITAQIVADKLQEVLGQPVVVENHPGGGTVIGTNIVATSEPDGYTLLLASNSIALLPTIRKDLSFNVMEDLTPVGSIARQPFILVVHPDVKANSVQELLDLAKAEPGSINYASAGAGTGNHLAQELFTMLAGVEMQHVPYQGTGPSIIDLLAGRVDMTITTAISLMPHIREGKMRALGVGDLEPLPELPDVPPIAEAVPGYEATSWNGMFVRAGTPPEIITKLNEALHTVLADEEVAKLLANNGAVPDPSTPEEFGQYVQDQIKVWADVIEKANIEVQ